MILITSDCGTVVMDMLSKLLANLAEDQLIELHYGNRGLLSTNKLLLGTENCFPTLKQMEFIWARQRKLHQTYHSKHIPTLFKALEKNTLEASAILCTIKELILIEEQLNLDSNDLVTWSLKNVYMPVLRKLKLARYLEACKALGSPFAILWERNLSWKAGYRSRGFRFCLLIIVNPIKELPRPAFTGAVSSRDIRGEPWGGHCQLVQEQKSGG